MVAVSSVSGFIANFFAKPINKFVGNFNMLFIAIVVMGIRLVIYSLV